MRWTFRFQPTIWTEVIRQGVFLAIALGWVVLDEQQRELVLSFSSAVLAAVNWSFVAPSTPEKGSGQ
jgi:hypothetical protein